MKFATTLLCFLSVIGRQCINTTSSVCKCVRRHKSLNVPFAAAPQLVVVGSDRDHIVFEDFARQRR